MFTRENLTKILRVPYLSMSQSFLKTTKCKTNQLKYKINKLHYMVIIRREPITERILKFSTITVCKYTVQ